MLKTNRMFFHCSLLLLMSILSGCGGAIEVTAPEGAGPDTQARLLYISLTPAEPSIAKDTSQQFIATGIYSDDSSKDLTEAVAWSSSDADVADIGSAGLALPDGTNQTTAAGAAMYSRGRVHGRGIGKTHIWAHYRDITGSTTLTVTGATLVSLAIGPTNPGIAGGTTQQFTATGTFSDNTTQDLTTEVTWISSDTGAATIDASGLAVSATAGSTTITAASGGVSGSTILTVTPAALVSIAVTPAAPGIAVGTTQQFTATGTYSDNSTQDLTASVTWSSSNADAATLSNASGSKGLSTAVAAGTSTLRATSGSVSGSATLTVTAPAATGSATLIWTAPATNQDGTPLTDLAGYKIHYGTSSGSYTETIEVGNVTAFIINDLAAGAYYFAVTAYNSAGYESSYSMEAGKAIP